MGKNKKKGKAPANNAEQKNALAQNQDNPAPKDVERKADALKEKGTKMFTQQKYPDALEFFTKAIEIDGGKDHTLFANRSATNVALTKFEDALKDAEKCIELAPKWSRGYLRKGTALQHLFRYLEAYSAFKEGLILEPEEKSLTQATQQMEALLSELKISESEITKHSNPDAGKFENMCKWMLDGGSKFPMMYMQYYGPDSRGVHALTKVPAETMILYVPLPQIMTSEVAKDSEIGKKLVLRNVDLRSQHSYLAAYLCQEKANPKSYWRPYIDNLPEKYANMPIFFTDDELKNLEGSFILPKIHDRKRSLKAEYDTICKFVPEFSDYATHWDFVWARLVVITRIFGIVVKDNKTDGLVPYADMLNHKIPRETRWTYDGDVHGFTIITNKTLQRGEEIFDSYGRKCNSRFFVNYGFTIEDNEDNEAVFRVAIPRNDPHWSVKIRFLGGDNARDYLANREFQIPAAYTNEKTREAFSFLRFAHARDEEMTVLPSELDKLKDIPPISERNEAKVLDHLRATAKIFLQGFPTTLEEDEKWLKEHPFGSVDNNVRNCHVFRIGEKKVLYAYISLADECIPLLKEEWKKCKQKAAKYLNGKDLISQYIQQALLPLRKPGQKRR